MSYLEGIWEIETDSGFIWRLQYPHGGLRQMAGYGLPNADYVTQKAPGQHGESHLGYTLQPRTIEMGVAWRCASMTGRYGLYNRRRRDPYRGLNYMDNPLILRRVLLDGTIHELHDVWYTGGVELDSANGDRRVQTAGVGLVARDPVWYDAEVRTTAVTAASMATGDELVFDTPAGVVGATSIFDTPAYLTFGSSGINLTLNGGEVTTLGDWPTFPTITVVGPASDVEIENLTSGHMISMDYDIVAGRTVTFDLRYGYKTVTDDLGTNLAGYVPAEDDLADFVLWPDPLAAGGENDIRIFCGNATNATSITIAWYDRYQGI